MKPSRPVKYSACGTIHIQLLTDEEVELVVHAGKNGSCLTAMTKAFTDSINLMLKHKIPKDEIAKALQNHKCEKCKQGVSSCIDAIARAIKEI